MKLFLNRLQIMLTCLLVYTLTGCVKDEFETFGQVVEGKQVNVSLNLTAIPQTDIVVTRADNSHSYLSNLTLFVYSGDGNIFQQCVSTFDKTLTLTRSTSDEDGVLYLVADFKATSGIKKLLGVANASITAEDSPYWASLQSLAEQAKSGELTFEELKLSVISLRNQYATADEISPIDITSSDQMLMSGWNEGVAFDTNGTVTNNGTNVGGKDVILRLNRSMARITFNIPYTEYKEDGENKIFTPTSFQVFNVPVNSYLGKTGKPSATEGEGAFKFVSYTETNVEPVSEGNYSFAFYMPENICDVVTHEDLKSYHDRDKWNAKGNEGANPADKSKKNLWTHAPATSTFVVIKGTYEQTGGLDKEYTGTVEYTVHLGDFSPTGNVGNYSVERNCSYTYTVKVLNVKNIVVEAQKDPDEDKYQQGSEGSIYDYTESDYAYRLDAHYEQVYLQYNLSEIAEKVKNSEGFSLDNVDEAIANALVLTIQSEAMDYEHPETEAEPYSVHNKQGRLKPYQIYVDAGGATNENEAAAVKNKVLSGNRDGQSGFDYKWVEFWPQTGTTIAKYPGVSDWSRDEISIPNEPNKGALNNGNIYGGELPADDDSQYLLDVYDVIVAMGKVIKVIIKNEGKAPYEQTQIVTGETNADGIIVTTSYNAEKGSNDYVARFTAFVNEYYYYRHPLTGQKIESWSLFTNKMPREMTVALSTSVSSDGNSTYSVLYSYISQLSIETFYSSREENVNGFGIETYNETPLCTFGNYNGNVTFSRTEGRDNQLDLIHAEPTGGYPWGGGSYFWQTYIDNSENGWTNPITSARADHVLGRDAYNKLAAYVACLSRNRDLNGNEEIDDEEVRWYLPSLNEYIRIGIGAGALSNIARLYTGDKQAIRGGLHSGAPDIYPLEDIDEGTLYYTSSGIDARVFWAVEKGSYSAVPNSWAGEDGTSNSTPKPIRCIRLLPGNGEGNDISTANVSSDATYEYDINTRTFTFSGRLEESLYRERVYDRLDPHDEDDAANRFYQKIKVASRDAGEFPMGQIIRMDGYSDDNPCAKYHEDDDGGATWRVPNLVELSAMHAVPITHHVTLVGNGHACCTQFSNQKVRYGFRINQNQIQAYGGAEDGEYLSEKFSVRCVRDVP